MLNTYLHEKHVPVEEHLPVGVKDTHEHGSSGEGTRRQVAATNMDDQAVNDLDKCMRQKTDAHLLRVARKEQKCKHFSRASHTMLGWVH